ncbi:MAG: hypothetical protein HC860_09810, partial [Alkalinema sp. RU_4_3]|nr:hypothetical protein [Alkalinema sp. RU_4_3]
MAVNSSAPSTTETQSASELAANLLSRLDVNRLQTSPEGIVLLLALVVGGGAGLLVVVFRMLIVQVHSLVLEDLMGVIASGRAWVLACAPVVGGIVVGLMRWRMKEFGSGLSSLNAAVQNAQDVPVLRPIVRGLAAAVSRGVGGEFGAGGAECGDWGECGGAAGA